MNDVRSGREAHGKAGTFARGEEGKWAKKECSRVINTLSILLKSLETGKYARQNNVAAGDIIYGNKKNDNGNEVTISAEREQRIQFGAAERRSTQYAILNG